MYLWKVIYIFSQQEHLSNSNHVGTFPMVHMVSLKRNISKMNISVCHISLKLTSLASLNWIFINNIVGKLKTNLVGPLKGHLQFSLKMKISQRNIFVLHISLKVTSLAFIRGICLKNIVGKFETSFMVVPFKGHLHFLSKGTSLKGILFVFHIYL